MKVLSLLVFVALLAASSAQSCWSDADCNGGCCTQTHDGNVCKPLAKLNDVCDLEGQGLAQGACPCEKGLVCEKIDLGVFGDVAASANPLLEKYHFGWCEEADSVIG